MRENKSDLFLERIIENTEKLLDSQNLSDDKTANSLLSLCCTYSDSYAQSVGYTSMSTRPEKYIEKPEQTIAGIIQDTFYSFTRENLVEKGIIRLSKDKKRKKEKIRAEKIRKEIEKITNIIPMSYKNLSKKAQTKVLVNAYQTGEKVEDICAKFGATKHRLYQGDFERRSSANIDYETRIFIGETVRNSQNQELEIERLAKRYNRKSSTIKNAVRFVKAREKIIKEFNNPEGKYRLGPEFDKEKAEKDAFYIAMNNGISKSSVIRMINEIGKPDNVTQIYGRAVGQ